MLAYSFLKVRVGQMPKPAKLILIGCLIAAAVGYYLHAEKQKQLQRTAEREARMRALAVTMLSTGEQQAWERHIEQVLEKSIFREGSRIVVPPRALTPLPETTYYALSQPYSIGCSNSFGKISVVFGKGDNATYVGIVDPTGIFRRNSEPQPALSVVWQSIAGKKLFERLCHATQRYMLMLTKPNGS